MFKKLIVLCTAVLVTQVTFGAVFIKFDGVDGESNHAQHRAYSDVLSWSWGSTASVKSNCIKDFHFVKEVDKSSPVLLMGQVTGKAYPEVRLAVTANFNDGGSVEYLVLVFKNVRMSSHSTASGGDSLPTEQISLNFSEVTYSYTPIADNGQQETPKTATISSSGKCA